MAWVLATAAPAAAHAVPVSSTPTDRSRVETAPSEVTVTFSEAVTSEVGGLTVLNRSAERVDQGSTSQPSSTTIATALLPDLPSGTYIANYKVISADGHPVSGSIVFAVGDATIDADAANSLATSADTAMDVLAKVGQFALYVGALLAAGLAFFVQFLYDGGPETRRLGRIVQGATVVGALGLLLGLMAQAALATGTGLGAIFDLTVLRGVLKQGLGWQDAGLLVGLALCHASVVVRHKVTAQALAFYGGLAATASFVLWGHATESDRTWLTIPADITHVVAAAVWFGGLVGVGVVLRARIATLDLQPVPAGGAGLGVPETDRPHRDAPAGAPGGTAVLVDDRPRVTGAGRGSGTGDDGIDAGPDDRGAGDRDRLRSTVAVVRRFSTVAAVSLVVLAAAGLVLGWVETGSVAGLTTTTYGRLLLAKVAVVALVAFIAGYNRFFLLPWLFQDVTPDGLADTEPITDPIDEPITDPNNVPIDEPAIGTDAVHGDDPEELRAGWRSLLNTVGIEALLIVAVLALTAVLANTPPGRTSVDTEIFQETRPLRGGEVTLTVTPNTAGPNAIHVDMVDANHRSADLATKVTLEMEMPEKGIGPITREMLKAGHGHFFLEGVDDLAVAGDWRLTLVIRISDFEQERLTFQDPVR